MNVWLYFKNCGKNTSKRFFRFGIILDYCVVAAIYAAFFFSLTIPSVKLLNG